MSESIHCVTLLAHAARWRVRAQRRKQRLERYDHLPGRLDAGPRLGEVHSLRHVRPRLSGLLPGLEGR